MRIQVSAFTAESHAPNSAGCSLSAKRIYEDMSTWRTSMARCRCVSNKPWDRADKYCIQLVLHIDDRESWAVVA